ncbi:MAG: hypothetical protein INF65_06010 [Roseomonas sp.]|nr:hypothetical protein [Roseomonas sp.]MCA3391824.1 hypothetical protein [Roseomonas sp.]MCA3408340.1 hypothetical protein [Roseomonas sp.]
MTSETASKHNHEIHPAPGWLVPVAGILVALIVMFLRRPDILLDAKLWAEDGRVWYAEAHSQGPLAALLRPETGYFQTISRLVFGLSSILPLEYVPLFANSVGLLIRAALVGFLLSRRFDWIPWPARLALVLYYLLMPRIGEVHANITNTHWYLALYALMVAIASPAYGRAGKIHDYAVFAIAGLSGPFILLLTPCLAVRVLWDAEHRTHALRLLFCGIVFSVIQSAAIVTQGADTRSLGPLGATAELLVKILGSRVIAESILPRGPRDLASNSIIVLLATTIILLGIRAGGWRALCIALLGALQMAAAMASPIISHNEPQWPLLMIAGDRYFVIPRLTFIALVLFAFSQLRARGRVKAVLAVIAILTLLPSFRLKPVQGPSFAKEVNLYREANQGDVVALRIAPPPWTMTLVRR